MVKQAKNYGLMSDPDVNPDIRSLQHLLLFGIKGMAAYTDHAAEHDQEDEGNYEFVHRGLASLEDKSHFFLVGGCDGVKKSRTTAALC